MAVRIGGGAGAGDIDDPAHAGVAGRGDEVLGPARVDLHERLIPARRLHRRVLEGEGDDERIDAREGWRETLAGRGRRRDRSSMASGNGRVRRLAAVRQHDDPVAAAVELRRDPATDEAGPAGDGDGQAGWRRFRRSAAPSR